MLKEQDGDHVVSAVLLNFPVDFGDKRLVNGRAGGLGARPPDQPNTALFTLARNITLNKLFEYAERNNKIPRTTRHSSFFLRTKQNVLIICLQ